MHEKHMRWHVSVQDWCLYGSEVSKCVPKSLMSMKNLWLHVLRSMSLSQFVHQILCLSLPPTTTLLGPRGKKRIYIYYIFIYLNIIYI